MVAPTLLITDDDRDFRETIQNVFQPRGFQTFLAGDGEEALSIVRTHEIHLVLLDMHMPKLTGVETINRIKQTHEDMPCILISGGLTDQIREQAALAFDILSKPVNFQQITQTVHTALKCTYRWEF